MVVRFFLGICLLASALISTAQSSDSTMTEYDEIMGMVSLYKYMLNTVGEENTPVREKETIINTSYLKIFRDSEVQIEDDLQEVRSVILNKAVSAYLRDIDFFFQSVRFSFSDITIDSALNENGNTYYQVKLTVQLDAIDLENKEINRTYDRYLEINTVEEEGLKIVSVYTTKQDMSQQLMEWWSQMDSTWRKILADQIQADSIGLNELKQIVRIDSLDLSRQFQVSDISPLSELRQLVYLNLTQTQVTDLLPIRYASNLKYLNISYTSISELDVLSYFKNLSYLEVEGCHLLDHRFLVHVPHLVFLNLSETALIQFGDLSSLRRLKSLDLSSTSFEDTRLLSSLDSLQTLNLSKTSIKTFKLDSSLPNLQMLDISNTFISDIQFVDLLPVLEQLSVEYTDVSDLSGLTRHSSLKKVLADFSKVKADRSIKL